MNLQRRFFTLGIMCSVLLVEKVGATEAYIRENAKKMGWGFPKLKQALTRYGYTVSPEETKDWELSLRKQAEEKNLTPQSKRKFLQEQGIEVPEEETLKDELRVAVEEPDTKDRKPTEEWEILERQKQ